MFGYVRPYREELKVRQLEEYQALYCGLCHTMGHRHGLVARMFLNYDFVFLAMLLAPKEDRPATEYRRCIACPHRKKCVCTVNAGLAAAADESVILSYWKLRDTVEDGGFWKGTLARCLSLLLRRGYRKAAAYRPEFDAEVRSALDELHRLEAERSPSLDRTADTFARILQAAAPSTNDVVRDRATGQLLYHVGRWIYLVDAWDDLAEDLKSGSYNPVRARFEGQEEGEREYMRTTLHHSLNLAVSAFGLVDFGSWGGVISNILYFGLPAVEELVFRGEWAAVKKMKLPRGRLSSIGDKRDE
ncbi:MAG: DUF5685 family protein [Pseudoflavonifractor sp.]